jgi:acyl-CoA synthetase (AMP-forming)/AMP-acid ligase II
VSVARALANSPPHSTTPIGRAPKAARPLRYSPMYRRSNQSSEPSGWCVPTPRSSRSPSFRCSTSRGGEVNAYIQLKEGVEADELTPAEIVEARRTRLAGYKVPRYVEVRKSEFERTPYMRVPEAVTYQQMAKRDRPSLGAESKRCSIIVQPDPSRSIAGIAGFAVAEAGQPEASWRRALSGETSTNWKRV